MNRFKLVWVLSIVLILTSCTALQPASIDKAEKLLDQDKLDEAVVVYEELIDEDEEDYEAWFGLVELYMDDDEYEDAADVLEDLAEVLLDEYDVEDDDGDIASEFFDALVEIDENEDDLDGDYEYINDFYNTLMMYYEDPEPHVIDSLQATAISNAKIIADAMATVRAQDDQYSAVEGGFNMSNGEGTLPNGYIEAVWDQLNDVDIKPRLDKDSNIADMDFCCRIFQDGRIEIYAVPEGYSTIEDAHS